MRASGAAVFFVTEGRGGKSVRRKGSGCSRSAIALLAVLFAVAGSAVWAHQDPPNCGQTGVSQQLAIYRADGVTLVGSGTVTECETLVYQSVLGKPGGDTV